MRALITADLHLTDNPQHEYRWAALDRMIKLLKSGEYDAFIIAGDLTHDKNNHNEAMIHRVQSKMIEAAQWASVHIIRGNHCFEDFNYGTFTFLDTLQGIYYYSTPKLVPVADEHVFFMPFGVDHYLVNEADYEDLLGIQSNADLTVLHECLIGSKAHHATMTKGVSPSFFSDFEGVLVAGDIHKPQEVRCGDEQKVTYCGMPYPMNFGDDHKPRLLCYDAGELTSMPFASIQKVSAKIRDTAQLEDLGLCSGDMLNVCIKLKQKFVGRWDAMRAEVQQWCKDKGVYLHMARLEVQHVARKRLDDSKSKVKEADTSTKQPAELLRAYGEEHKLAKDCLKLGEELLKEAQA